MNNLFYEKNWDIIYAIYLFFLLYALHLLFYHPSLLLPIGSKSLPGKYSHFSNSPDDDAEIFTVSLAKLY